MWQMTCTGRAWCDVVSYDDRLPEPLRHHVIRIERDDARIAGLEEQVAAFLAEVNDMLQRLQIVADGPAAGPHPCQGPAGDLAVTRRQNMKLDLTRAPE
jgi:hypothetical protein